MYLTYKGESGPGVLWVASFHQGAGPRFSPVGTQRPKGAHKGPREAHKGPREAHRGPRGAHKGPSGGLKGPRGTHKGPRVAHKGPGGPAHKGPGGPTRARPIRVQGGLAWLELLATEQVCLRDSKILACIC